MGSNILSKNSGGVTDFAQKSIGLQFSPEKDEIFLFFSKKSPVSKPKSSKKIFTHACPHSKLLKYIPISYKPY